MSPTVPPARLAEIAAQLRQQLTPQGFLEEVVLSNLARALWNQERALATEGGEREATRCERSFYRALAELRRLQTDRALRQPSEATPSPAVDQTKLRRRPPSAAQVIADAMSRLNGSPRGANVHARGGPPNTGVP